MIKIVVILKNDWTGELGPVTPKKDLGPHDAYFHNHSERAGVNLLHSRASKASGAAHALFASVRGVLSAEQQSLMLVSADGRANSAPTARNRKITAHLDV